MKHTMRDLIQLVESAEPAAPSIQSRNGESESPAFHSEADIARVIQTAKKYGFSGFGGDCGEAAIALNRVVFGGKGEIVGAFNRAFLEQDHAIGHVAVRIGDAVWDADGSPKTMDDIEHWGMLDLADSDYREQAEEYWIEWDDHAASEIETVAFDSDEEVLKYFDTGKLNTFIRALQKAVAQLASPAR